MVKSRARLDRRGFLGRIAISWAAITSFPFIAGIMRYVYPPLRSEVTTEKVIAAKIEDIPMNSSKIVRFNKRPVIVVHTRSAQFKAFMANCTHLGCVVEYRGDEEVFHCNCHGSRFDLTGRNIAGPAPTPLQPVKVTVEETNVILRSAAT